jgi:hypothetical protein
MGCSAWSFSGTLAPNHGFAHDRMAAGSCASRLFCSCEAGQNTGLSSSGKRISASFLYI